MKKSALMVVAFAAVLAGCESQSHLQVDVPRETTSLTMLQSLTSAGTAVVLPLVPSDPFPGANKVTLLAGTRGADFLKTTMVLPVGPGGATASVPVMRAFVATPLAPDAAGNTEVLVSVDGRQARIYPATVTTF